MLVLLLDADVIISYQRVIYMVVWSVTVIAYNMICKTWLDFIFLDIFGPVC